MSEISIVHIAFIVLGALGMMFELPGASGIFIDGLKGAAVDALSNVKLGAFQDNLGSQDSQQTPRWVNARFLGYQSGGWTEWCWNGTRWSLPPRQDNSNLCAYQGKLPHDMRPGGHP